jgi:uncharacterized membrane protein
LTTSEPAGGRGWPWAIAIGLALVVLVNVIFAYIAISGSDGIVESYQTEQR